MRHTYLYDSLAAIFASAAAPIFRKLAGNQRHLPKYQAAADRGRFQIRGVGYYEPTYPAEHLPANVTAERKLPGLDLNDSGQLELLQQCKWSEEISGMLHRKRESRAFDFEKTMFGRGDADMLYNFIRLYRPARVIEIGSGDSTLIARFAITKNAEEIPDYVCDHVCIEPYEMPWLETAGVKVIRERVENVELDFFLELRSNDILFIDSSHVIRPFGDVTRELQQIVPSLAPGVIVHVHDIFTPRDYPEAWLRNERRLWSEQYLLEAFLAYNSDFEILAAVNWLKHNHFEELSKACPSLLTGLASNPGSFWFRRRNI